MRRIVAVLLLLAAIPIFELLSMPAAPSALLKDDDVCDGDEDCIRMGEEWLQHFDA